MSGPYEKLNELMREVATLSSVAALLGWDQETMMPRKAAATRAESLAMIGSLAHERLTSPQFGELLSRCEEDPQLAADPDASVNLRELRRDFDRASKLPTALVAEMSETSSHALEAWKQARKANDFDEFRPWLEKQVVLNRRKAECYGAPEGGELYDALIDDFEPGMTSAELERIFAPLRDGLTPLIAEIASATYRPDNRPNETEVAIAAQKELSRFVLERLGFDIEAGRFDTSVHPFSSGVAPGDTRITSRFKEEMFFDALGSTMHEAGHALYEQGLPKQERWGQPLAEPVGLGIHESQSRMWENHVGRSRPFWCWALPEAQRILGDALRSFSVDELYEGVNIVRPNLIRVESDEATYNLHIMLRFDLERAMLRGDLVVADLPSAWNARIRQDLGLEVPDNGRGCLQDIHWSMGSIGYFPTYTLGNLYAAQFYETILTEFPDLENGYARGEFASLLGWLRKKIHARGRRLRAPELCRELTGQPLSHEPLLRHLERKLRPIYRLSA